MSLESELIDGLGQTIKELYAKIAELEVENKKLKQDAKDWEEIDQGTLNSHYCNVQLHNKTWVELATTKEQLSKAVELLKGFMNDDVVCMTPVGFLDKVEQFLSLLPKVETLVRNFNIEDFDLVEIIQGKDISNVNVIDDIGDDYSVGKFLGIDLRTSTTKDDVDYVVIVKKRTKE